MPCTTSTIEPQHNQAYPSAWDTGIISTLCDTERSDQECEYRVVGVVWRASCIGKRQAASSKVEMTGRQRLQTLAITALYSVSSAVGTRGSTTIAMSKCCSLSPDDFGSLSSVRGFCRVIPEARLRHTTKNSIHYCSPAAQPSKPRGNNCSGRDLAERAVNGTKAQATQLEARRDFPGELADH
jgi:hypothetical protein